MEKVGLSNSFHLARGGVPYLNSRNSKSATEASESLAKIVSKDSLLSSIKLVGSTATTVARRAPSVIKAISP